MSGNTPNKIVSNSEVFMMHPSSSNSTNYNPVKASTPFAYLPVLHSTGQQSSDVVSMEPSNQTNLVSKANAEKISVLQKHLVLLIHADKCQRKENQSSGEMKQCTLPFCSTMKHVLNHLIKCTAGISCLVPHCSLSRQIISHWKGCTYFNCPMCLPIVQVRYKQQQQQPVSGQAPQCSLQNPVHVPIQQTTETQLNTPTRPLVQNNLTGAARNQPAKNFLFMNDLESEVKTKNTALIRTPTTVPEIFYYNPAIVKAWHQHTPLSQDLRRQLIQKIVSVILPFTDISSVQDIKMINLTAYAQEVEKDIYNFANRIEEYNQMLSERINRISKKLEEKTWKGLLMQQQHICNSNLALRENAAVAVPNKTCTCPVVPKEKCFLDFRELFRNLLDNDVFIIVKGQIFSAHSLILETHSPILAATVSDAKLIGIISMEVEDCDPSCFSDFLCYLYNGDVSFSYENVFCLYTVAYKYEVLKLKAKCIEFMKINLCYDTFNKTLAFAQQYSETELIKFAKDFLNWKNNCY